MTYQTDDGTTATLSLLSDNSGLGPRWSLAETEPKRLVFRLATAALAVGIVGGIATALLSILFGAADVSPAARILAIGLPLVLITAIGWRLAADAGLIQSAPSGRWIAGAAAASVVLIAAVQGWSGNGGLDDGIAGTALVALAAVLYGTVFGLMPAVAIIVVLVPTLLLLRASRVRIALPSAQLLLTAIAMAVAAVFVLWVTAELHTEIVTGMAVALAGTGTVLTARWGLVDRQA